MKKPLLIILVVFLIFACENKSDSRKVTAEANTTAEKIAQQTEKDTITKPETTEIWEPEPEAVSFDENGVPSDAIVLFDGTNLDAWESAEEGQNEPTWTINNDGTLTVAPKTGDIRTKQNFGDIQLHLEWRAPDEVVGEGQGRGNSGVFLQERYEVQVLDSYDNRTYSNGQAASVYKQHIPLVNATRSPGEWQEYDIVFHAPVFDEKGNKTQSGTLTVFHNGVLVQDHVEVKGTTEYIGKPKNEAHGKAPIKLQDHGNPVHFRNIWVREL